MIIDSERIASYIRSLEAPGSGLCEEIRRAALAEGVPIIRPETASLLTFFVRLLNPRNILEVGCAVGYSALRMSEAMPAACRIVTMEKDPARVQKARENFRKAGETGRITLLEGDAAKLLETLDGSFDLIFMDAAKGQYIRFLPEALRLLSEGGVLFSDNVLQDGDVLESRFAVTRRNRTIHARMREYLYVLKHTEGLSTSVIPIGDGAAVTLKERTIDPDGIRAAAEQRTREQAPELPERQ